jgi:translation initiation factor 2B subunit (eIF-2B alpha/beta/delta family)
VSNEAKYYNALKTIARDYQTAAQLRRRAGQYGLDHVEELEMAYENIQEIAKHAIKGKRRPAQGGPSTARATIRGVIGARPLSSEVG